MHHLTAYLMKLMVSSVPISAHSGEQELSVNQRYQEMAEAILTVTNDSAEAPLFKGEDGRLKTSLLMLSIARFESSFARGPIHGDCEKANGKCTTKPKAFCMMQVQPGPTGIVLDSERWRYAKRGETAITGDVLDRDPLACVRVALHMARESMQLVGDLGIYTGEGKGGKLSANRMQLAKYWLRKFPVEKNPS